jgi:hypothetical protein
MCNVDAEFCSALGPDPSQWSRIAPMSRPESAAMAFHSLSTAISLAGEMKSSQAVETLQSGVPDPELFEWFVEHAQY